jgi:hypothetical protein
VHVCAAHSCAANTNQNFIISYARLGYIFHDEARACGFFYKCFH